MIMSRAAHEEIQQSLLLQVACWPAVIFLELLHLDPCLRHPCATCVHYALIGRPSYTPRFRLTGRRRIEACLNHGRRHSFNRDHCYLIVLVYTVSAPERTAPTALGISVRVGLPLLGVTRYRASLAGRQQRVYHDKHTSTHSTQYC